MGEPLEIPNITSPVTANLDGDAADDIVLASGAPAITAVPGATPTDPFYHPAKASRAIAALDFDGDGDDDIVAAQSQVQLLTFGYFAAYRTQGAGFSDAAAHSFNKDCTDPVDIATAHLDADEHEDVVVACAHLSGVLVLKGMGAGAFGPPVPRLFDASIFGLALADVLGSEWPDLIAYDQKNPRLLVYPGTGELSFDTVGMQSFAIPVAYDLELGDLDGDGATDVLLNNWPQGCGVFHGSDDGLVPGGTVACGPYPVDVALGDMNGDSLDDIVAVQYVDSLPGSLHVMLNQGDSFAAADVYETGFNTSHVALGDYDGDSRLDAAVVSEDLLTFYYQTE